MPVHGAECCVVQRERARGLRVRVYAYEPNDVVGCLKLDGVVELVRRVVVREGRDAVGGAGDRRHHCTLVRRETDVRASSERASEPWLPVRAALNWYTSPVDWMDGWMDG